MFASTKWPEHGMFFLLAMWGLWQPLAMADTPLFLQWVDGAEPAAEALSEATKQVKAHKKVTVLEHLSVEPFHRRQASPEAVRKPLCLNCHLAQPHRKSERNRSFLNMHSRFIACETCHLKRRPEPLQYRWLDFREHGSGDLPASMTQHFAPEEERQTLAPLAPYPGARIAPFSGVEGVVVFADHPLVEAIARRWKEGTLKTKALLKAKLHQPLKKKGAPCQSCHRRDRNMLDLPSLGADGPKQRAIEENAIARFFRRYKGDDERLRIRGLLQ